MPVDPRQWSEALRWLARADDDLRVAEALLAPALLHAAAFHCQQAAEKMAKAVLIARRQPPPRLHAIEELGRRVKVEDPAIGQAIEELAPLTRWYASARYPDTGIDEEPGADDIREALARLHELRRKIDDLAPQ